MQRADPIQFDALRSLQLRRKLYDPDIGVFIDRPMLRVKGMRIRG